MITVKLIGYSNIDPLVSADHAARLCYQSAVPEMKEADDEKLIPFVRDNLFGVGHHTTLQHTHFTFAIDGLAVGDVTFGLHLTHPFYSSDQRSGRYASKMFTEPNFEEIEAYLRLYYPEVSDEVLLRVMEYVKKSLGLYANNIGRATEIAKKLLKEERPRWSEDAIDKAAPKIAQEQLRMLIPIIFPTALDHTVNLSTLVAIWEAAYTPVLRDVTNKMKDEVLKHFPSLGFMFDPKRRRTTDWACELGNSTCLSLNPSISDVELLIGSKEIMTRIDSSILHPVDKLHFTPELMDSNVCELRIEGIRISVATMGQDQRHRTVRRSVPRFTGSFYLPPIVDHLYHEDEAFQTSLISLTNEWRLLYDLLPGPMAMTITPYGAVVTYDKIGSINAVIHELGKRTCFCAQEEIYNLARILRDQLTWKGGISTSVLSILEPPCLKTGVCAEGGRFCGRDMSLRQNPKEYFPRRRV